jgi:hypothetical protein
VDLKIQTTDRYGRSVAELNRNGRNLNQALVASGAAFVYWQYISSCDRQTYSRLENEARMKRLGVWGVSGGVTRPWDYRLPSAVPAPHPPAGVTPAARSAPMPRLRSCCGRGTTISTGMVMGRPVRGCEAEIRPPERVYADPCEPCIVLKRRLLSDGPPSGEDEIQY